MPAVFAQQDSSSALQPQAHLIIWEGYAEAYFTFDLNEPAGGTIPYFVSFNRHNEFNINLAYVAARYSSDRVRAVVAPGFGTYVNSNYAAEPATLKNIIEANVGFRPFRGSQAWLDMGVFSSPYTNETPISMDQPTLTRSFAPEYVPYYVSGARLTLPLGGKLNLYGYLFNGWQQMQDVNTSLAFGTWLEYKPRPGLSINWNTYTGDERSTFAPANRLRFLQDIYVLYAPSGDWSFTASAYTGWQQRIAPEGGQVHHQWWQANVVARYAMANDRWLYGRVESFNDPHSVVSASITGIDGYQVLSGTLGFDASITSLMKFRIESRCFFSDGKSYVREGRPVNDDVWFSAGLTARFK